MGKTPPGPTAQETTDTEPKVPLEARGSASADSPGEAERPATGHSPPDLSPELLQSLGEELAREFPTPLDTTSLVLMDVDPHRVHAFWHVCEGDLEVARAALGPGRPDLVLRLRDVTPAWEGTEPWGSFDIQVQGLDSHCYVDLWQDGRTYEAALALRGRDGTFVQLAVSDPVATPLAAAPRGEASVAPAPDATAVPVADESLEPAAPASLATPSPATPLHRRAFDRPPIEESPAPIARGQSNEEGAGPLAETEATAPGPLAAPAAGPDAAPEEPTPTPMSLSGAGYGSAGYGYAPSDQEGDRPAVSPSGTAGDGYTGPSEAALSPPELGSLEPPFPNPLAGEAAPPTVGQDLVRSEGADGAWLPALDRPAGQEPATAAPVQETGGGRAPELEDASAPPLLSLSSSSLAGAPGLLEVHAELHVFGRAQPGSRLRIFGRPVALRPDGSFSVRRPLPAGALVLPLELEEPTPSSEVGPD